MLIRLLAIGTKMPEWVTLGYQDYVKRLSHACRLELIEIPLTKRNKNSSTDTMVELESDALLAKHKPGHRLIALHITGQSFSTETLARTIQSWQAGGKNIDLMIGGPDGLSPRSLQQAETLWSLSPLTLPHPLVRILVAEQIYRAECILRNHPYHR